MTWHLNCAFRVIILPSKRVIAFFPDFFLQIARITDILWKANSTITFGPPCPVHFTNIDNLKIVFWLSLDGSITFTKQMVRQAVVTTTLARYVSRNVLAIRADVTEEWSCALEIFYLMFFTSKSFYHLKTEICCVLIVGLSYSFQF